MCKRFGVSGVDRYYLHEPASVIRTNVAVIMWDVSIITDRRIVANRPDLVIHNKKERTCLLIDVAVPDDKIILMKQAEKMIKYKDLEIEITRMWNVKARTVPVIVGALGTVKKEAEKNTDVIPGDQG